jgi:hypothetical protein
VKASGGLAGRAAAGLSPAARALPDEADDDDAAD